MQKTKKRVRVERVSEGRKCKLKGAGRKCMRPGQIIAENHNQNSIITEAYLTSLKRRRYSRKSINTFKLPLKQFISFLAALELTRLQDVSPDTLEAWSLRLQERKLSDATRDIYMRSVRNLSNWMESEGMLFDNPARNVKPPRYQKKLPTVHSEKDISRLLEQPSPTTAEGIRDRALLEIGYSCALRREELARLTLHDPDFLQNTLRIIGKGSRERMLPLARQSAAWLRNYTDNARKELLKRNKSDDSATDALWINHTGRPLTGQGINGILKQHGRDAAIKPAITIHALRRACATHMLRNGAHPIQIQMLLGHADMSHLSQYLRLTITDIKKMHQNSNPGK